MKTVDFTTFKVTTDGEEKEFFEEGLIHNDMEMLSVVDARKHYEQLYNDDSFFNHHPKDIEYILDLYQKLELFDMSRIDFDDLENSIIGHSSGENQPVWIHCDGDITEIVGNDFTIPDDQCINPIVAVFKSFTNSATIEYFKQNVPEFYRAWKKHIKESIESKMIEIEAEHIK